MLWLNLQIMPRRRNLWVSDTFEWRPEARLTAAEPGAASAFCVRSQLPFEPVCPPPVRRYGVKQEPIVRHPGWIHGTGPQKTRQPLREPAGGSNIDSCIDRKS